MPISNIGENAIGSAIGFGTGVLGSAINLGLQKNLMKSQFEYQKKAFQMQNDRQNWLMENSVQMQKNALRAAGYSTADPNGTGVTPAPTGVMASPTQSGAHGDIGAAALQGISVMANARLADAQAEKLIAETDMQYLLNDLKRVYGESEVLVNLYNLDSQSFSNIANAMKADQDRKNSIQLTEAQVRDINQHLEIDWQKLEPELQVMCEQIENLKAQRALTEADEKKVWQEINESNARISRLMKENQLTDADIAVAKATESLKRQETRTEKNRTVESYQKARSAKSEADINKIEADARKALGSKYYKVKEVLDVATQSAERISKTVKNFKAN